MRKRTPAGERRLDQVGDQRLADGADEDREDRDAELVRADEAHRLVHEAERDVARRARRLSARSSRRARRAVMSAYSAATNTALPSTRRSTITMRRKTLTPRQGRRYLAGISSPTLIRRQYR